MPKMHSTRLCGYLSAFSKQLLDSDCFLKCLTDSVTDICRSGSLEVAKTEVRLTWSAQEVWPRIR